MRFKRVFERSFRGDVCMHVSRGILEVRLDRGYRGARTERGYRHISYMEFIGTTIQT